MKNKKKEAVLIGYKILFDTKGNLITERISTDIKKLKKYLNIEDYNILRSTMYEATLRLNEIHNQIEVSLDARK